METNGYITPLTAEGEAAAAILTGAESYGGAVAYRAQPCIVVYGIPAWIMPNGTVRVGDPDAPAMDAAEAAEKIRATKAEA